jgi:hypothetical protein
VGHTLRKCDKREKAFASVKFLWLQRDRGTKASGSAAENQQNDLEKSELD